MTSPEDTKIRDLLHLASVFVGVGNGQARVARQFQAVAEQQAERAREIARLAGFVPVRTEADRRGDPSKPYEFGPVVAARSLRIGGCPDSSVWFQIDNNGKWIYLEPRLAELLRFLASQAGGKPGGDGLVGFRTRAEIHAHLEKTGGRTYDRQYVNKLVKKLKDALDFYDKRGLVVSSKRGARFLVRHGGVEEVRLGEIPAGRRSGGRSRREVARSEAGGGHRAVSG
jgi:hypothetical protein